MSPVSLMPKATVLLASGKVMGVKTPPRGTKPWEVVVLSVHAPTISPAALIPAAAVEVDPGKSMDVKTPPVLTKPCSMNEVGTDDLPGIVDANGLRSGGAGEDVTEGTAVLYKAAQCRGKSLIRPHDQPGAVDARSEARGRARDWQDLVGPSGEGECGRESDGRIEGKRAHSG